MDLAIHVYLEDLYDIIVPLNMKTYPLVDFKYVVLDIQLASLYASSTLYNQYS
jgi:hypothetical protein